MDHHSPLRVDLPLRQGVLAEIEAFSALTLEGEPDGSAGILSSPTLSRTYRNPPSSVSSDTTTCPNLLTNLLTHLLTNLT